MRRLGPFLLVLLVALTGISLGHARGQVLAGGTVVLCSGAVLAAPGEDGQAPLVCPDMALSLMSATAVPPPILAPVRAVAAVVMPNRPERAAPVAAVRAAQARGPPGLI